MDQHDATEPQPNWIIAGGAGLLMALILGVFLDTVIFYAS